MRNAWWHSILRRWLPQSKALRRIALSLARQSAVVRTVLAAPVDWLVFVQFDLRMATAMHTVAAKPLGSARVGFATAVDEEISCAFVASAVQ